MPGDTVIRLEGVGREFRGGQDAPSHALAGISLDVGAGEMVAIVGPAGAGKTVLFNILACLDRPTSGTYQLLGRDAGAASEEDRALVRNRRLGLLYPAARLVEHLSLQHNVELPLEYGGGRRYKVRARDALARVGIADAAKRRPAQVTPVEARLTAVARALVMNPHVVLADEPVAGLDAISALRVLATLQKANTETSTTVVITTKDPDVAMLCTRVVSLDGGRVAADDPVRERRLAARALIQARQAVAP